MWTIPQRRRAPIAGTCGAQEQSPTTRTVIATVGKIGRPTGKTQEGRARPKNLLRQQKRHLQLMMGGITRTGRTLLTLFCTARKGRLCWLIEGRKFYAQLEYLGWPYWSVTFVLPIHSPFFYPGFGKKKSSIWIFYYIKVALLFFKGSGNYILLALLKLGTVTFITRMFKGKKNQCEHTFMAQPCMCRLIGIHPVLI